MAAANIIDSLFVSLGFKIEEEGLDAFQQQVEQARADLLGFAAGLAAAAGGIGLFVGKVAASLDDLGDFAERENVAIEAVQELGHAAQLNGSSLEALKASISGVNRVTGEAVLGIGRGAMTFEKLGMSAKNADGSVKSFDQILEEVADRMQGLSRAEQIAMAEKLGIDRSLIPLLTQGADKIRELRAEAQAFGVASEEDAAKAGAFMDSLDRTKFVIGALGKSIAVGLMPRITEAMDGFRAWLVENGKIIKQNLGRFLDLLSTIIGRVWSALRKLGGAIVSVLAWLEKFKIVTIAATLALGALAAIQLGKALQAVVTLTRAMMAFNAAALTVPLIIGAIAIAIGLLIDDYLAFKEGSDSVIGDLVEAWPIVGEAIAAVEEAVGSLIDYFAELWETVREPLALLGAALVDLFAAVWPIARTVLGWIGSALLFLIPIVLKIAGFFIRNFAGALTLIANVAAAVFRGIATALQFVADNIGLTIANLGSMFGAFFALLSGDFSGAADYIREAWDRTVAYFAATFPTLFGMASAVFSAIGAAWNFVVGGITSVFQGAADFISAVWDGLVAKVTGALQAIQNGIAWVGEKLGLEMEASVAAAPGVAPNKPQALAATVAQAPALQPTPPAGAPAPAAPAGVPRQGVLGVPATPGAQTNNQTATQTTNQNVTVNAPITVNSSDPAKAGQAVREELNRANKNAARNGQTAVAL